MTTTAPKQVYLSIEQFDKDLENDLTIIKEPTKRKPYYVCECASASISKSIVHIYITR